jgi:hypothetical protein
MKAGCSEKYLGNLGSAKEMIIQLNDIDPFPAFVYGLALFHRKADLIVYISCLLSGAKC